MIFCAEIGSMHKGIPALAFEMIRQAKLAGADIAKFQLGHTSNDPVRYIDLWAQDLKNWCDYFDIEFMASIFSLQGLKVAQETGMERYKIAFSIARDRPDIVEAIAKLNKETFISHSGYNFPCLRRLFVVAEYPTYPNHAMIPHAFSDTGDWYGYSSHVHGIEDALIAVARGARYVEKHVTLDKTEESIKDNHFALSFDEFAEMVRIGRGMERLLNG